MTPIRFAINSSRAAIVLRAPSAMYPAPAGTRTEMMERPGAAVLRSRATVYTLDPAWVEEYKSPSHLL